MAEFTCTRITTSRLGQNVWTSGPHDGTPVLFVGEPGFVQRLAAKDASADNPQSAPRVVMRTFYGGGANAANIDEDFLTEEVLRTQVGEDFYPGDATASENWPGAAPGRRGVLNTMSPAWFNASGIVDLPRKPPIVWLRGTEDKVVSDASLFDLATLGQLGAVPGWPGADVMPPQPMDAQLRAVLAAYRERGGEAREVAREGIDHGIPLAVPGRVAQEMLGVLVR